jgi:hypothetical protein
MARFDDFASRNLDQYGHLFAHFKTTLPHAIITRKRGRGWLDIFSRSFHR